MIIRALSNYWLEKNATKLFWVLFALQLVCWTLIPALTQPNAPLDVVEGFAWGREWPLGTYKHPPLQAWLLEMAYQLFGSCPLGYFGLSALCTAVALWAVYRTGRLLCGKTQGLVAAMLAQAILYFNFLSPEFNPNVLQLAAWALGGYAFAHALIKGKIKYWVFLGAICAAGFYAKYTMALVGVSYGLFILFQRQARKTLLTPGPYIAKLVAIALLVPHVLWLVDHHFLPFFYAAERAQPAQNSAEHLLFPLHFALSQLACLLPALIAAATLLVPLKIKSNWFPISVTMRMREPLVFWLAFGPLLMVLAASLITGEKLRDMWGMPFLSFIPLWLVSYFKLHPRWKLFAGAWSVFFVLTLVAFAGNLLLAGEMGFKPLRGHFPGRELSAQILKRWQDKTHAPLVYVIGDAWMAGNVALYAKNQPRPHVWIDGGDETSQWINPQKVKLDGAVLVWRGEAKPDWMSRFPGARMGSSFSLLWQTNTRNQAPVIGWAWLPPK